MILNFTVFLLALFFGTLLSFSDASTNWQLGFQDPATPYMEGITSFHNNIMFFIVLIVVFTSWLLFRCLVFYDKSVHPVPETFTHSTALEVVWTVLPAVILMIIAVPSFALLYSLDEVIDPAITLKVVGHQWYWSYEYSDYNSVEGGESLNFDSYMIPDDELEIPEPGVAIPGGKVFRLLEVDNRVKLPVNTHIRVLVTAADVLHSWAVPSLGVKVDACPGRLNQVSLFIKREGVFYGQCSEICGVNHGFMPIVVEGVSLEKYIQWIQNEIEGIQLVD